MEKQIILLNRWNRQKHKYEDLEIHTAMGFGYGVCEDCYEFEWKRREKDGI